MKNLSRTSHASRIPLTYPSHTPRIAAAEATSAAFYAFAHTFALKMYARLNFRGFANVLGLKVCARLDGDAARAHVLIAKTL
jgi:hypothetical protein